MFKFKTATNSDFEALKTIKPGLDYEIFAERQQRQEKKEIEFLILLDDTEPLGFAVINWLGKPIHPEYPDLFDIYVKEEVRGKGYGSVLIIECERRVKNAGFSKIGLAVNPTLNPKAKSFYERLGYMPNNEPLYVDGVYDGVEDWVLDMEKEI